MDFIILYTAIPSGTEKMEESILGSGFNCVKNLSRIKVFFKGNDFIKVNENGYVFYTHLFRKNSFRRVNRKNIIFRNSVFRNFINKFYGKYVLYDVDEYNKFTIYRDITGSISVFYKKIDQGFIITSSIKLIYNMCDIELKINKEYALTYVFNGRFISNASPFYGIYELPPGCSLCINKNLEINVDALWFSHLSKKYSSTKKSQITEYNIINILKKVINSYIAGNDIVQIDYSGGLDSTCILLATKSILHEKQDIIAIHAQPKQITSESNENMFVEEVMKDLNIKFQEVVFDEKKILFSHIDEIPNFPNYIDSIHVMPQNSKSNNAFTLNGEGGDQIFCTFPLFEMLIDIIKDKEYKLLDIRLSSFKKIFNLTNAKVIHFLNKHLKNFPSSIIGEKVRDEKCRHKKYFINLETIEDVNSFKLRELFVDSPGKFYHIELFLNALSETLGVFKESNRLFPMLEEPFLELILLIPTYNFYIDKFDRFPLRNAFSREFYPYKALWRKDKGYYFDMNFLLLKNNKTYVTSLIQNGQLMRLGLINKSFFDLFDETIRLKDVHGLSLISNVYLLERFFKKWDIQ